MNVHADIQPFAAQVREEYLYDLDTAYVGKTRSCTIFAVSSYKGHYPTFRVLLDDGAIFDYLPSQSILVGRTHGLDLSLEELTYSKVCPDFPITVNRHPILAAKNSYSYFPTRKLWLKTEHYVCSVDWYTDNHNTHLVCLENGQVAFVPNHKILFMDDGCPVDLPSYRKLHSEWKPT